MKSITNLVPDGSLRKAIEQETGKKSEEITTGDLERIRHLYAVSFYPKIKNLEGLQYCTNLLSLNVSRNEIEDIRVIGSLSHLRYLNLSHNNINNPAGIERLVNLEKLNIGCNYQLQNITLLQNLENLVELNCEYCGIEDLSPLCTLTTLRFLLATHNKIQSFEPLKQLPQLASLNCTHNPARSSLSKKDFPKINFFYQEYSHEYMSPIPPVNYLNQRYSRDKPHMTIGTIGHIDHGKTTLTAAICKVLAEQSNSLYPSFREIDIHSDEHMRGISIYLKSITYSSKKREYTHFDCPGHADYVKNMLVGTARMDAAILVVAADEGCGEQTREHLLLAGWMGVEYLIVFINKCDTIGESPALRKGILSEIKELCDLYGFTPKKTSFVFGSALKALSLDDSPGGKDAILQLIDTIERTVPIPEHDPASPLVLPIHNRYSHSRSSERGTIITGRILTGTVSVGETIELTGYGSPSEAMIKDMEIAHGTVEKAVAGEQVGIFLANVKPWKVKRGELITRPSTFEAHKKIRAQLTILSTAEGGRNTSFKSGYTPWLFSLSGETPAAILLPENTIAHPGETINVDIVLYFPLVILNDFKFVLRDNGRTVALGKGFVSG
ncbi:MAG: hypothetical protein GY754_18420 [bacterium]|nr:hypothetical protein [bacterium]